MKKVFERLIALALTLCMVFSGITYSMVYTSAAETDDEIKVLFVGNSMTYYNTLCEVVEEFANEQGENIECEESTVGGVNLIYHTTYSKTVSAIESGSYDVFVLQDIVGSFDGDDLMEGATTLSEMILDYNPNAKIILYEPWPVKGSLDSLLPYFTYNYIKTADTIGASLAPAGEAWYTLYYEYPDVSWYCSDGKHPHAIGTFVSACSVYYAMFPDNEKVDIDSSNEELINKIINDNIAHSEDSVMDYDSELLDDISSNAFKYSHEVLEALSNTSGDASYVSVAGEYIDPEDTIDAAGLIAVTGTDVDSDVFSAGNGNIAIGCNATASSEKQSALNATDGNTRSRWESNYEDPTWLCVDLGEVTNIEKVGFIWEGAYAARYYIQVSDDEKEWKTVAKIEASKKNTVQIDIDGNVSGRYVRMYGTKRGTGYGYSCYEMGVWGGETEASKQAVAAEIAAKESASQNENSISKGDKITLGKYNYKVKKISGTSGSLQLVGVVKKYKKTLKTAKVPSKISTSGCTFKVEEVGKKAFKGCKKLKKITLGKNVESINNKAFTDCKKLSAVTLKGKNLKKVSKNAFNKKVRASLKVKGNKKSKKVMVKSLGSR